MTRNIYLEGELALKFGAQHSFHGDSVRDALRLLDANNPGFKKYFIDAADCDIGFHIEVGGQELDNPLECLLPLREGDIIITPIAAGSKSGGGKILAAIAIAGLIMINPGFFSEECRSTNCIWHCNGRIPAKRCRNVCCKSCSKSSNNRYSATYGSRPFCRCQRRRILI